MGVKQSPDLAQATMENLFRDFSEVEVYIDDIGIFSDTWQEQFTLCKTEIRGIGKDELVFFLRKEVDNLPKDSESFIKEVGKIDR